MSLATKKVATVLVGSVLVLALSFAFVTPAKADMLSELQAQVQALLAQIAALGGGSTTTSGSGCYAFTMTHQQGDTGGEVMQIQKFLNSHGAMVAASGAGSPGNESSYFGAMTKAAVAKWQAANGVSPAAGYWGPVTRAKVASVCASAPTTPTTPGSTGGEVLNGSAGSITVTSTSADVEDQVFTATTEKVLGFRVEASGSDVRVSNIRVKFTAAVDSSASDRLADYASDISIWANGTKIASMAPSSFVRDSAGVYSASIPVSQVIRMGSGNKVTFHVGMTALDGIDSDNDGSTNDWTAELVQTRYTDPTGATLFDTTGSISNAGIYVSRLSSSSDVKLRMAEGSGNPKAGNVEVDDVNTTDIKLLEFTLKAEGADMEFDRVVASTTAGGVDAMTDIVQEFYLKRGSTTLDEDTAGATTGEVITFSLSDTETISSGNTETYSVWAKVKAIGTGSGDAGAFDQGDTLRASTTPNVGDINAKSVADGKSVTNRAGSVTSYTQTFYSAGIQIAKVGESAAVTTMNTAGDSFGTYTITVRVTAFGSDDVYVPLSVSTGTTTYQGGQTTGFAYGIVSGGSATTTGTGVASRVSGGTLESCNGTDCVKISGGSSADLKLSVTFNPLAGASTQSAYLQLYALGHRANTTAATASSLVQTTPTSDFRAGEGSAAVPN